MPQYTWECQKCREIVEIYARVEDIDTPPTDVITTERDKSSCPGHTWRRVIRGTQKFRRGDSWSGKKGEW